MNEWQKSGGQEQFWKTKKTIREDKSEPALLVVDLQEDLAVSRLVLHCSTATPAQIWPSWKSHLWRSCSQWKHLPFTEAPDLNTTGNLWIDLRRAVREQEPDRTEDFSEEEGRHSFKNGRTPGCFWSLYKLILATQWRWVLRLFHLPAAQLFTLPNIWTKPFFQFRNKLNCQHFDWTLIWWHLWQRTLPPLVRRWPWKGLQRRNWTLWVCFRGPFCCIYSSGSSGGLSGHLEFRVKACGSSEDTFGSQHAAAQVPLSACTSRVESAEERIHSSDISPDADSWCTMGPLGPHIYTCLCCCPSVPGRQDAYRNLQPFAVGGAKQPPRVLWKHHWVKRVQEGSTQRKLWFCSAAVLPLLVRSQWEAPTAGTSCTGSVWPQVSFWKLLFGLCWEHILCYDPKASHVRPLRFPHKASC